MNKHPATFSTRSLFLVAMIGALILGACNTPGTAPLADPNAFNTMVAQTALAQPTIPRAVTAPPTAAPPAAAPTITPTQGPPVLVNASVSFPRHTALDLETQAITSASKPTRANTASSFRVNSSRAGSSSMHICFRS